MDVEEEEMDEEEEEMDEEEEIEEKLEDVVVRDLMTQFNEEGGFKIRLPGEEFDFEEGGSGAMGLQEDGFEEEEDEAQAMLVQEQQNLWAIFEGAQKQAAHGAGALEAETPQQQAAAHFAALHQRMTLLMAEMEGDHSPEVSAALQQELDQVWAQMEAPAPLPAPVEPVPAALVLPALPAMVLPAPPAMVLPAPPAMVLPAPPATLEPWEEELALGELASFDDLDNFQFVFEEEEQQHEA
jgi:hypothetical protein